MSPRFGVLLASMILSICFLVVDILAVTHAIPSTGLPDGINPFWKLAYVFRCLTDMIVLDDFKTALDRLKEYKMQRMGSVLSDGYRGDFVDVEQARKKREERINHQPHDSVVRDFSKPQGTDFLDLESALRMDDLSDDALSGARSSGGREQKG